MPGQQGTRWTPDRVAIVLGVAGSMAGNVAWSWPRSPVLVGVGVCMSLVLPVAVRLWRAIPTTPGTWAWWERTVVMAAICGGAGLYSLVHTTLLLLNPTHAGVNPAEGLPGAIAWVPVVVMELLVVMAARAGAVQRASASPRRDSRPAKTAPSRPAQPSRVPAPSPVSPARPQLVPEPQPVVDGDEPPVPGETDAEKRRRQERNKKRRQRAKKATEQDTTTTEEVTG